MTDASNTQTTLPSKIVSSSARPSTSTNDKENLPSTDKQHRPTTAAVPNMGIDHSLINGTNINNPATNSIITSASIDASTTMNTQHMPLKPSASGGPPVSSITAPNTTINRPHVTEKGRSNTVRVPGSGVRRRETIDPVPGGGPMRKMDNHDKSRINSQDP